MRRSTHSSTYVFCEYVIKKKKNDLRKEKI